MNKKLLAGAVIVLGLIIIGALKGQGETEEIPSDQVSAEIFFTSNRDTGARREEIYSMNSDGGDITRVTFTDYHHFILGIDGTGRYIAVTRATNDSSPPSGVGDEARARYGSSDPSDTDIDVFVMDKDGGSLRQLTDDPAYNDGAVWIP